MTAFTIANPVGAITAAALTAGEAFLRLIGVSRPPRAFELSAWTGHCGLPGTLPHGPRLSAIAPIDALLVGCGNVMNGWAAAARALQITGQVRAVDRQLLGEENLGPYPLARHDMIGQPKTTLLAAHLQRGSPSPGTRGARPVRAQDHSLASAAASSGHQQPR